MRNLLPLLTPCMALGVRGAVVVSVAGEVSHSCGTRPATGRGGGGNTRTAAAYLGRCLGAGAFL